MSKLFQDSIRVSRKMEYNYEDTAEVPDLHTFKEELIEELLKSAFFQHKSDKKYKMLKLPIIAAPGLIRKQVNNDYQKETLMEKEFKYKEDTLAMFQTLIDSRELKIGTISDLKLPELQAYSKRLGIYSDKKTGEIMRIDLINLSKIFLAGQVWKSFLLTQIFVKNAQIWYETLDIV